MPPELNHYYDAPGGLNRESAFYVGISFAAHLVFVFFLLFMPARDSSMDGSRRFESLDVQLVSLGGPLVSDPARGGGGVSEKPVKSEPLPQKDVEVTNVPESIPLKSGAPRDIDPSATVKLPTKPEPTIKSSASSRPSNVKPPQLVTPEDLKRKEQGRQVSDTVRRLEQETAEDRRQASVRRRVEELEGEVGGRSRPGTGRASGTGTPGGQGRAGGGTAGQFTRMQIYQAEVRSVLRGNWVFSETLAGNTRGLESRVVMKIMPNGKITDVWFEKRSGNPYLDESAYKTVMKSNPLPPLPEGEQAYDLMVGFTPGGIQ
jgi:colicin import membrane protein